MSEWQSKDIQVTRDMIVAGLKILWSYDENYDIAAEVVTDIYREMESARRAKPEPPKDTKSAQPKPYASQINDLQANEDPSGGKIT